MTIQTKPPQKRDGQPIAQFNITKALDSRPLERIMLTYEGLHHFITAFGWAALTLMVWPRYFAPFQLQVREIPLKLPRLHSSFQGYRIAFISDLHIGKTRQSYLHETLRKLASAQPDLVLIGGDLIDYHPRSLPLLGTLLNQLKHQVSQEGLAPDGLYTIFGNHDYYEYSWRHVGLRSAHRTIHRRMVAMLEDSPVRLLRNQSVVIRHPKPHEAKTTTGGGLQIVGMDEMWSERFDADLAFANIDPALPTLCLQHNPDGFELLHEYPWDLLLCGHSHGGQVDVPIIGPIYVPMIHRQYLRGFYEFPGASPPPSPPHGQAPAPTRPMFVSTGIGYTKPLRFRVPPEIVIFTLQAN